MGSGSQGTVVDVAVRWPVEDAALLAGHEADMYSVMGAHGPMAAALRADHVNKVGGVAHMCAALHAVQASAPCVHPHVCG